MSDANTQGAGNTPATSSAQPVAGAAASAAVTTGAPAPAAAAAPSSAPAATSQQATEGQPAAGAPAAAASTEGDKNGTTAAPKPQGAPEKYEFKAPEGVQLDATVVDEFSAVAKELGLPQDAAQKVIDKLAPAMAKQNLATVTAAMDQASTRWVEAVHSDKEIGGDKLQENLAVAKKALDRFGTPELRALLGKFDPKANPMGTGLGNHPEIIKAFYRAGKSISEDRPVPGGVAPSKGERDAAKALYPTQA